MVILKLTEFRISLESIEIVVYIILNPEWSTRGRPNSNTIHILGNTRLHSINFNFQALKEFPICAKDFVLDMDKKRYHFYFTNHHLLIIIIEHQNLSYVILSQYLRYLCKMES